MNKYQAKELGLSPLARWASVVRKQTNPTPPPTPEAPTETKPIIEITSLTQLNTAVANCTQCPLHKSRTNPVVGKGDPTPGGVLFIGEGPGREEDQQGIPFVGPSGKLLDAMLASIKLTTKKGVYIANAVKCHPAGDRNPTEAEIATCNHYLQKQIELLQPKLIVLLGKIATVALLGEVNKLGDFRQKVHDYHGIPVLVHYHPAYLLRNLKEKRKAWSDLLMLQAKIDELGFTA